MTLFGAAHFTARCSAVVTFAVCSVGWATVAQGYLLPADYIVRILVEKRHQLGVHDISVHLATELDDQPHLIDERLYLKQPERLRLVQQNDVDHIHVQREEEVADGRENDLHRVTKPRADLFAALLMPKGRTIDERQGRLVELIKRAGIDTAVVSLGRADKDTVYIIGANPGQPDVPQIWFDKATFMPVRYVLRQPGAGGTVRVETRLLDYGSDVAGNFPRVVENFIDHTRTRRAEVVRLQVNKNLPETLFQIPQRN